MKRINGVFISDIHFGAMDSKTLSNELKIFLDFIENYDLDIIIFGGDLFDTKLSFNSSYVTDLMRFLETVRWICTENNIALRIIQGTLSHDLNQLDSLDYLYTSEVDFRIYRNIGYEKFKGYNLLFIPEEYLKNYKKYYNENIPDNIYFDIGFAHGSWDFLDMAKYQSNETQMYKAPLLDSEYFLNKVKVILSGHYHQYTNYENKIFYSGSYSRWKQGEEKNKGFIYFSLDNEKFKKKFIVNDLALKYITIDLEEEYNNFSAKKIINLIKQYKEKNNIYKLTVKIDSELLDEEKIEIIKEYFKNNKYININTTKYLIQEKELQEKKIKDKTYEIFDKIIKSDNIEDAIYYFLRDIKKIELNREIIRVLLQPDK